MTRFDPSDWLSVAKHLAGSHGLEEEEAAARTAVGRAYYAVLLRIAVLVEEAKGVQLLGEGSHGLHTRIRKTVRSSTRPSLSKLHLDLQRLEDLRVKADYMPNEEYHRDLVEDALQTAGALMQRVNSQGLSGFKTTDPPPR